MTSLQERLFAMLDKQYAAFLAKLTPEVPMESFIGIRLTDNFLPFVDNWAVCDIMSPKVFAKHKEKLLAKIKTWSKSSHVSTCRFGIETLMSHYLDKDFKAEYLEIPASVRSEEYYVKMMVAWFFATALAKQWDQAIPYIEQNRLAPWTHNKTIQKAIESYRITPEQKEYLRTLKVFVKPNEQSQVYLNSAMSRKRVTK